MYQTLIISAYHMVLYIRGSEEVGQPSRRFGFSLTILNKISFWTIIHGAAFLCFILYRKQRVSYAFGPLEHRKFSATSHSTPPPLENWELRAKQAVHAHKLNAEKASLCTSEGITSIHVYCIHKHDSDSTCPRTPIQRVSPTRT